MTTYTAIPNADIDTDSPVTQSLMTLVRDNPIALAEGASGAPRIQRAAIKAGVGHRWFFDYGDESDLAQAWTTAGSGYAPGLWQCTTFSIAAGQVATLSGPGPLIICATTSIIINGTLDVDGMGGRGGYRGGGTDNTDTPGDGEPGVFGGGGGGGDSGTATGRDGGDTFMTAGGNGSSSPTAGAAQSARAITTLLAQPGIMKVLAANTGLYLNSSTRGVAACGGGGGGAGGNSTSANDGGDGGGLVILCAPVITIGAAGVVTADGVAGGTSGGGGGGGAIIVATPASGFTNGGTFTYSGAASGGAGGAGATGHTQTLVLT